MLRYEGLGMYGLGIGYIGYKGEGDWVCVDFGRWYSGL